MTKFFRENYVEKSDNRILFNRRNTDILYNEHDILLESLIISSLSCFFFNFVINGQCKKTILSGSSKYTSLRRLAFIL